MEYVKKIISDEDNGKCYYIVNEITDEIVDLEMNKLLLKNTKFEKHFLYSIFSPRAPKFKLEPKDGLLIVCFSNNIASQIQADINRKKLKPKVFKNIKQMIKRNWIKLKNRLIK